MLGHFCGDGADFGFPLLPWRGVAFGALAEAE